MFVINHQWYFHVGFTAQWRTKGKKTISLGFIFIVLFVIAIVYNFVLLKFFAKLWGCGDSARHNITV